MARCAASVVPTLVFASALAFGAGAPISAQTTSPPAPAAAQPKWEIEGHFGGAFGSQPTGGTPLATFPVGESFVSSALRPSRYASTWYFGDGAALLNQIAAAFLSVRARITPLDQVLTRASLERKNGLNFGARVNRRLTSRLTAEFSVDSSKRTVDLSEDALIGIEAARASFGPTWNGLIATGGNIFFTNGRTSSTSTLVNGTSVWETSLTGAVNVALTQGTRLTPHLTAGAGVRMRSGDLPTARLLGAYQFTDLGVAPFQQSDDVLVHFAGKDTAPVGVFGGGVKYALSPRQGLRADVRVHVGPSSLDTLVDAQPTWVLGTPTFAVSSTTTPSLVFSNTSLMRSNLTGPAIADLKTFTGSGLDIQTRATVGYFLRFPSAPVAVTAGAPRAWGTGRKWELEAHGGGAFGGLSTAGRPIAAFPVGASFTAPNGFSSRYASSWYFGDGATLINQILPGLFGPRVAATRMTPLDPVLTAAGLERRRGPSVGGRVSRRLTPTVSAEFAIDSAGETWKMTRTALSGIEATRASFSSIWDAFVATGATIFLGPAVSSNTTLAAERDGRQTLATGAAIIELPLKGRVVPYTVAGGGVRVRSGDLPTATLTGHYQFRALDIFPFNETDVVTVHFAAKDKVPVGFFGGGVKLALTERQGLRVDVRMHVSANAVDTLVDAHPNVVLATPASTVSSGGTPFLVLSNSSAIRSNLTGPAIADLKTFTGSGRDFQTNLTVGYFVRF